MKASERVETINQCKVLLICVSKSLTAFHSSKEKDGKMS